MEALRIIMLFIFITIIACFIAFCVWFAIRKKQGLCPFCIIKQHMRKSTLTINVPKEIYEGGDSDTPPMGWSSWNAFSNTIDEKLIYDTAVAMKETGLADAGYRYVNIDDCWHSSLRDKNGRLQGDLVRFPSGIKSLVEKVNALGLKLGLYSSNGDYTCEDLPASLGHEEIDAETFAKWGVEYFKYDFCHNVKIPSVAPFVEKIEISDDKSSIILKANEATLKGLAHIKKDKKLETGEYITFLGQGKGSAEFTFQSENEGDKTLTLFVRKAGEYEKYIVVELNGEYYEMFIPASKAWNPTGRYQLEIKTQKGTNTLKLFNPVCTRADSAYIQYKRMGEALKKAAGDKKLTYSICEWGKNDPKNWAPNAGNLWRTTFDIRPVWKIIMIIYNTNVKLSQYAGKGHWNDPDMLEVGNGKLTFEENKSHFSLWCMMAAPLILGNDLRKLGDDEGKKILEIVMNKELIAIDQDALGHQAVRYKQSGGFDYLAKKLSDGGYALCVLNKSATPKDATVSLDEVPEDIKNGCEKLRELWSGKTYLGKTNSFEIPAHGCIVLKTES